MNDAPGAELDLPRARLLVEMAEIALGDLSGDIFLPDGWDLLQLVRSGMAAKPLARGFYAAGRLGGAGSPRVAVLALALPWQQYLDWTMNAGGNVPLAAPPAGVAAGAPGDARFDKMLGEVYSLVRGPIWQHLAQALREGNGTLWITAKNLAGPLAHLAALDLRPGNTGPQREPPPATRPACWTFSAQPAGNAALKTFADANGGAVTNVWAGTAATPVDFFPTAPGEAQGYALPGSLERVAASIPELDEPWSERGGPFYLKTLKGQPGGLPTPGRVVDPPNGFVLTLAHSLSRLSLVAYQRRQHPQGRILDVAPFALKREISSGGVPWCALFESTTDVVAAFRGTVTADELMRITAESSVASPAFLPGRVHAGALRLYTGPSADGATPPSFRAALVEWLRANAAGRRIYLAGHDLGGALAELAALDLRNIAPDLKVEKVYTFGDTPLGDIDFNLAYAAKLANDSYRVMRDGDFARRLQLMSAYVPLPRTVMVTGAPADDDVTRHSLASYITLLNPSPQLGEASALRADDALDGASASTAAAVPALTPEETAWLEARLARMGVERPRRLARLPSADSDGRIVLSTRGHSALPPLVPEGGGAPVFAADVLAVAPGDALVVQSAGDPPRLVVGRLELGEGARVSLPAGGELHTAGVRLGDGTVFELIANDGMAGLSGAPGAPGQPLSLNEYLPDGGPGDPGVPGTDGGPGGGALYLGSVSGTVTVIAAGGNGAPGGGGGDGGDGWVGASAVYRAGNGGNGGEGGAGGNGGPGGTVMVEVSLEPGAAVNMIARASSGSPGGAGGAKGIAGAGKNGGKRGKDGKPGEKGKDGVPGALPVFSLRRHLD